MALAIALFLLLQGAPAPLPAANPAQRPPDDRRTPAEVQRAARAKADAERAIEVPEVALSALRNSRGQWLGREVRFTLQFESQAERWNPWLTRFTPSLYRGFQAWSDEQFLWRNDDYLDVAPRLFLRRGTEVERRFATATRYERFRVRARVVEIFLDEPWIEILEAESLPERVGEGTILHAVRGLEALDEGRPQLAASELDRAAAVPLLPAHVARELAALRKLCVEDER